MPSGGIVRDVFFTACCNKGLDAEVGIVLAWDCSDAVAVRGSVFEGDRMLVGVSVKGVEMRVMQVGRSIDRAVWLAKRGGECQKFDPERMAGIRPLQVETLWCYAM